MNKCPPEILDRIFAFACTDGGNTGRSLSLVSRWVHDTSLAQKYNSIAIIGASRMSKFAGFLRSHTISVRYLMIDCGYPPIDMKSIGRDSVSWMIERGVTSSAWVEHINRWAQTILTALARSLAALYLFSRRTEIQFNSLTFPLLDTLYLLDFPNQHAIPWNDTAFPRLRRLNSMCQNIRGYTPRSQSTHINISTLSHFSCCIHHKHEKSLLLERLQQKNGCQVMAIKRLKVVVLHWGSEVEASRSGNQTTPGTITIDGAMKCLREEYPNVFCVRHVEPQRVDEEWWDVVSGGEGCFRGFIM